MSGLFSIAREFIPGGHIIGVREFGNGNINDTFVVTSGGGPRKRFILQRINRQVFRSPELVMRNMSVCTRHVVERLKETSLPEQRRWEVPEVLRTRDGRDFWIEPDGSFWRAVSFIEGARSFETVRDERHAEEVGYALGIFHTFLSDLPPGRLADTLEGFHVTPLYLKHYDEVLAKSVCAVSPEVKHCLRFVEQRRELAEVLEDGRRLGRLLPRTIHGDPKVNNILIDETSGRAVSMVDLDTVKPGLVHYDIGDCLRSGCNPLGEEAEDWESVSFDTGLCRSIIRGYLCEAKAFLTEDDFLYIYDSVRLISFELGLRFFTDHLEGNVYFRTRRPGQNLARALVQFRLTESIESKEEEIREMIRDLQ